MFASYPMQHDASSEIDAIRHLAAEMAEAEASGDVAFLKGVLAADVVIMPPGIPPIEGVTACAESIGEVLDDVQREFERQLSYTTTEVRVSGDLAVERGTFCHTFTSRANRAVSQEVGKFLRVYSRGENRMWKASRIIWNMDEQANREATEADG